MKIAARINPKVIGWTNGPVGRLVSCPGSIDGKRVTSEPMAFGNQRTEVPRDGPFAIGERPGLGGQDVQSEEHGRPDAQPSSTVEGRRQRDDGQSQGVQHESLLGPVGDDDPVQGHVDHRPEREERRPMAAPAASADSPRPRRRRPTTARSGRAGGRGRRARYRRTPSGLPRRQVVRTAYASRRVRTSRPRRCDPSRGPPGDRADCR